MRKGPIRSLSLCYQYAFPQAGQNFQVVLWRFPQLQYERNASAFIDSG